MQMMISIKSLLSSLRSSQISPIIENLLNHEGLSLDMLLNNDAELLQELRNQNKDLIRFFSPEILSQLLNYILIEPSSDDLIVGHKYPYICNEIILCDIPDILDSFFNDQQLLNQFFNFLNSQKLNLTLAGYFSSVAQMLLKHNSYELLSYLHETRDMGKLLVQHLYSTSVMIFLCRLMSSEDHGNPAYLGKLGEMVDFILQNFNESIRSSYFSMLISNSSQLVCFLLKNHSELSNWDYIQQTISESPNAEVLVNCSVCSNSVLCKGALNIIEAYLSNLDAKSSEETIEPNDASELLVQICRKMGRYCDILKAPKEKLGMDRLLTVKMIGNLTRLAFDEVKESLKEHKIAEVLIGLVKHHPWNSMLHNCVCDIIITLLLSDDTEIKHFTIFESGLIQFLTDANKQKNQKVGYFGIVGRIGNVLFKTANSALEDLDGWKDFTRKFLYDKNKEESIVLGQGVYKARPEIPVVDDVFFDAIEGPEDYEIPPNYFNLKV